MLFVVIITATAEALWALPVGLTLALLLSNAIGRSAARSHRASLDAAVAAMEQVRRGPWQAWPCRLEAVTGKGWRRLLLLAPDGSVACEFRCVVPDAVWTGMTDGRGLVWFVGDLRFGGFVGLPGGDPVWWIGGPVARPAPAPSGGAGTAVEEELARQAVKYVFDSWLR